MSDSLSLAKIAHEIRTPLQGMLGSIEALADSNLTPCQQKHADTLRQSSHLLLNLLDDWLGSATMAADRSLCREQPFCPKDMMEAITRLWQPSAQDKGLRLVLENQIDAGRMVLGDLIKLRQILDNLLSNAIKFTEGGSVRLEAKAALCADNKLCLHILVTDTGMGMSEQTLAALSRPFQRGSEAVMSAIPGAGMGLFMVCELAEQIGAKVHIDSKPGRGTKVAVSLALQLAPLLPVTDEPVDTQVSILTLDGQAQIKLLVVEDNALNRGIIDGYLPRPHFLCAFAVNAQDALDKLTGDTFDAVLMDLNLPDMSGIEATRRIRNLNSAQAFIPILMLSADASGLWQDEARQAGINACLLKPFDKASLQNHIRILVKNRFDKALP